MKRVVFDCFPNGRRKALHMSFDDGRVHDRRLVALFNEHGIRGTFFLNSGFLDNDGYLRSDEVAELFRGHEVGAHSVTHPCLPQLPNERIIEEILEDRRALERLVGYVVRGHSYPGCDHNDRLIAMLPMLGIAYAPHLRAAERFHAARRCLPLADELPPEPRPAARRGVPARPPRSGACSSFT